MKRREWAGKLALAGVSLVVTFFALGIAGELVLRYRERHRTTIPGTMPSLLYRHVRLRGALVRNFNYYDWVHINGEGFRGRRDYGSKPEGAFRIMAVGGSTTFDSFVSGDDRTWPHRLESWLRRLAPACSVEVINAGVPGYRVLDNLIRLQTELYEYEPDLVLLYHAHNDLVYSFSQAVGEGRDRAVNTPGEVPAVSHLQRWLERHSLLYSKVLFRWKILSRRAARDGAGDGGGARFARDPATLFERGADRFLRDLSSFLAVARSLDLSVAVPQVQHVSGAGTLTEPDSTIRAMWRHSFPSTRPEIVLQGYARFDTAARQAADAFGATYLPTAEFDLRGTEWYAPGDPIHFNDDGAERMGRQMAEALLEAGLLDPGTCRPTSESTSPLQLSG